MSAGTRHTRLIAFILAGLFLSFQFYLLPKFAYALAGVPQIISYQGRLANSSGDLLGSAAGTTHYFKFSIWDNATVDSGSRLWPTSSPTSVSATVRQGVFNVNVGDISSGYPDALEYNFNTNKKIYLQVEASSDNSSFQTLSPRQRITASAFAELAGAVSGTSTQSSFGTVTPSRGSMVTIQATTSAATPLTIIGAASQSVNLFRIQDSSASSLFYINSSGGVFASSTASFLGSGTSTFTGGIFANDFRSNLVSCDSLDTNASGAIICGTDATGGSAGVPNLIYRTLSTTKYYTASTSATDNLAWHFNNGFVSSASSSFANTTYFTDGLISKASSTFSNILSVKGDLFASSTIRGVGPITLTSTGTSTFSGGISAAASGLATSKGLAITGGTFRLNSESFSDLTGTGLSNTAGALTLDATGDWTGTIDGNNFGGGAIGAGEIIYGGSAGSFSELAAGTRGQVLMFGTGAIPVWQATSTLAYTKNTGTTTFDNGVSVGGGGFATSKGLAITGGTFRLNSESFSDLTGTGLSNTAGALTLDATGDWTGTIDGNNFGGGAIGAGEIIYGGSAGSFSELAAGTRGQVLMFGTGAIPVWQATSTLAYTKNTGTTTFDNGVSVGGGGFASSKGISITGGIVQSSGNLNITSSATSTLTNSGISVAGGGLATSKGLSITGGRLVSTVTATSSFTGGISADALSTNLVSCDSLDTNASGAIICGTDATGGSAGVPNLIYRTLSTTKYYTASTSATDNLAWHFNNGFVSSASSTIAGALRLDGGTFAFATSTPWGGGTTFAIDQPAAQGADNPIFVIGSTGTTTPFLFVSQKGIVSIGSSTPSPLFLNPGDVVIGRNGASSDVFISGGLGLGNATTTDGILETSGLSYIGGLLKVKGTGTSTFSQGIIAGGGGGIESAKGISITGGTSRLGTIVSGTWNGTAVAATFGGTGQTTYTTGDILYSDATNSLAKRAVGTRGQILSVSTGGTPAWIATSTFAHLNAANAFTNTGTSTFIGGIETDALYAIRGISVGGTATTTILGSATSTFSSGINITGGGIDIELPSCSGSNALTTDAGGGIICGAITAGGDTIVEKDADESFTSSTTMAHDTDLKFTMTANTAYRIRMNIWFKSGNAGDFKYGASVVGAPAGTILKFIGVGITASTTNELCVVTKNSACAMIAGVVHDSILQLEGIAAPGAADAVFHFDRAQNGSDTVATTVKKNSFIAYAALTGAADLAEVYMSQDPSLLPGEVVVIDPLLAKGIKRSSAGYERSLVGVISTRPALLIGAGGGEGYPVSVALAGRVPVKVTIENGPIEPGDFLTSSSKPGVAMKATKAGAVFGQALEGYDGPKEEIGTVVAFVENTYINGSINSVLPKGDVPVSRDEGRDLLGQFVAYQQSEQAHANLSEILTDRVGAGLEIIAPRVITDTLVVNAIEPVDRDVTFKLTEGGKFVLERVATSTLSVSFGTASTTPEAVSSAGSTLLTTGPVVSFDSFGNAFFAGLIEAGGIKADRIEGLEIVTDKISALGGRLENLASSTPETVAAFISKGLGFEGEVSFASTTEFMGLARALSGLEIIGDLNISGVASSTEVRALKVIASEIESLTTDALKEKIDVLSTTTSEVLARLDSSDAAVKGELENLGLRVGALEDSLISKVLAYLESIGARFSGGFAYLKNLVSETLTIGSPEKPAGITIYDTATGEPYCVRVTQGALVNIPGDCASLPNETSATTAEPDLSPVLELVPEPVPEATEPVLEPGTELALPTEEVVGAEPAQEPTLAPSPIEEPALETAPVSADTVEPSGEPLNVETP